MNWKISVYRFIDKSFPDEVINTMISDKESVFITMPVLNQEDVINIARSIKNIRCIFTASIHPGTKILGGRADSVIVKFKKK